MIPSLLEVALRALVLAGAVWAGLRLLMVRDVLAQKTAWTLALAGAILVPLGLQMALPAGMGVVLPANLMSRVKAAIPRRAEPAAAAAPFADRAVRSAARELAANPKAEVRVAPAATNSNVPVLRTRIEMPPPIDRSIVPVSQGMTLPDLESLAIALYLAVAGALIVRLIYGLTSTVSLWLDAEPVELGPKFGPVAEGLKLRTSRAIASPVTVGSGVVLPSGYEEWDGEKMRIVLAHERSHVRQGDFYLQLAAGLYSAAFWFSPLGWWLKKKLSDLGEAISDRAGLEQARSRSSYAQVLLEFAARPRPALIGVAMARPSSLSHRIERLLNDNAFRQAFAMSRRRALMAAMLVPAAFLAATAYVRVEAASQTPAAAAAAPAIAVAPRASQAVMSEPIAPAAGIAPLPGVAPQAALAPPADIAPPASVELPAPAAPFAALAPMPPFGSRLIVLPAGVLQNPPAPPANITVGRGESMTILQDDRSGRRHRSYSYSGSGDGYAYSFSSDGESYALVTDASKGIRFSGDWVDGRRDEIRRAAESAHGPFLWFTHEDKSYVVDDPAIVSQIEAMYKPIDDLGRQQEELGKQQEELGREQEELGRKQEQASAPAPDVSKEIARIEESLAKLKAKQGSNVTQEELGNLQEEVGDLQGRLGDLQGKIGEEQGRLGEEQGKLGEQQGKLGEQQGKLGEQQGRLAEDADRKVRSIIDQSLTNGKARQVQ